MDLLNTTEGDDDQVIPQPHSANQLLNAEQQIKAPHHQREGSFGDPKSFLDSSQKDKSRSMSHSKNQFHGLIGGKNPNLGQPNHGQYEELRGIG